MKMSVTSPISPLAKLGLLARQKSLKVMILGQSGVGKTAMVVRFITKRYIGEYDPSLEKTYAFHTLIDNEVVYFDILDTADQPQERECSALESNIRWAEAFILMYSVTDKCSFDECYRLKFLINYNKKRRILEGKSKGGACDIPVVLVGNKTDQVEDRMISPEEGQRRSREIGCVCFHEISVRESIEQVRAVFTDVCRFWRMHNKNPSKLRRNPTDKELESPDNTHFFCAHVATSGSLLPSTPEDGLKSKLREADPEKEPSINPGPSSGLPFRERASTDGHLQQKPTRWRYPPPQSSSVTGKAGRRMSISLRGSNSSY